MKNLIIGLTFLLILVTLAVGSAQTLGVIGCGMMGRGMMPGMLPPGVKPDELPRSWQYWS